jgi:hypothetical protein
LLDDIKKGTKEMIETLVKPQALDNDVAVIKILQLMGQLTPNDIAYVLKVSAQVYKVIGDIE